MEDGEVVVHYGCEAPKEQEEVGEVVPNYDVVEPIDSERWFSWLFRGNRQRIYDNGARESEYKAGVPRNIDWLCRL